MTSDWFKLSKCMPMRGQRFLMYVPAKEYEGAFIAFGEFAVRAVNDVRFYEEDQEVGGPCFPSHWMLPPPPPPKEDDDEA